MASREFRIALSKIVTEQLQEHMKGAETMVNHYAVRYAESLKEVDRAQYSRARAQYSAYETAMKIAQAAIFNFTPKEVSGDNA